MIISQRINKSNISKQAFLSVFQNGYFIDQILSLLRFFLEEDSTEYESHITLIVEILFEVFVENTKTTNEILFVYGSYFYDILNELKINLNKIYDDNDTDPINKNILINIDSLINLLKPAKFLFDEKKIDSIVNGFNDICFANVQKYNLNMKTINDEREKDTIRDYVKGMKMNIINYENLDVEYLDLVKNKGSLINEIFVAVKLINLSVIFIFICIIVFFILFCFFL
jgi:hypothetical protein